jgi:deoxycytidylate deaminase
VSFRMAEKIAKQSQFKQHRVGAVIVKGGNIVATGYNSRQPSKILGTPTRHAEAAAILSLLKEKRQDELVGSVMYVSRFTRGGQLGIAAPCPACNALIRSVGIRKVFYTTDDGTKEMKL